MKQLKALLFISYKNPFEMLRDEEIMKIKYFLMVAVFFLCFATVHGQEGHPFWWWDTKSADFIVEGVITYDPANYYELSPVNINGKDKKYFWIVGNLKINKVLFINKNSQHLESYQENLKNIEKDYPVLIPAYQNPLFSSQVKPNYVLRPILGLDIPKTGATILNLSQIYIFPILDLKLESVVPPENVNEAKELLAKRPNNFLDK